ncbi:glycosyltransferase family 1 protein [soil metagenome]
MKILFFQQKRELYYSVHIVFDIVREKLSNTIEQKVLSYNLHGLSPVQKIKQLFSVSRQEKGDIYHVVEEINYAVLFMKKRKTILTIHDVMRLYTSKGLKHFIFKWFWLRLPIYRSTLITAVSETSRNELLKYANCSPSKVRVIYNCIAPGFLPSPKPFNKKKPVLLQIGIKPSKNLNRVIMALEGIECSFKIVGKPSDEALELLHLNKIDFSWRAELTQQEIIQAYIDCDMVIFASLYEGFGVPIIEANNVERAVVTSNCSAMAEVAGSAACLVDPLSVESIRTGIKKVIDDDNYREKLIEEGRKNRTRFDAQEIADQYLSLYKEVFLRNKDNILAQTDV